MSKISEIEIMKYESFNIGKGRFDKDCFPTCSLSDIEKLESILLPKKEDSLEVKDKQNNFMGYLLSCYFKNRLNRPYNRVKAIVFDFDGTLTKSDDHLTTWQRIWIELGYSVDECNKLHQDFDNKKFSHQEWCDKTCHKFQEKHLTKNILSDKHTKVAHGVSHYLGTYGILHLFPEKERRGQTAGVSGSTICLYDGD